MCYLDYRLYCCRNSWRSQFLGPPSPKRPRQEDHQHFWQGQRAELSFSTSFSFGAAFQRHFATRLSAGRWSHRLIVVPTCILSFQFLNSLRNIDTEGKKKIIIITAIFRWAWLSQFPCRFFLFLHLLYKRTFWGMSCTCFYGPDAIPDIHPTVSNHWPMANGLASSFLCLLPYFWKKGCCSTCWLFDASILSHLGSLECYFSSCFYGFSLYLRPNKLTDIEVVVENPVRLSCV